MKRLVLIGSKLATYALGGALAVPLALHAAETDIANGPLGQAATPVNPNLMLILDDSLSMGRQFTPDYVSTFQTPSGAVVTRNCFDSLDSGGTLTESPEECWAGDPPAMSPDFNVQYYNPEIRYFPAVNYDGTPRISMKCEFTGGVWDTSVTPPVCVNGWTKVPTDNVSAVGMNKARKDLHSGSSVGSYVGNWGSDASPTISTMNLVAGFPDRVWCRSTADAATDPVNCRINSGYTYPDAPFGYGLDTLGKRKYKLGAPYYYRIAATEYCTDATLKTCVASETPLVVAGVSYNVPAPVRFCTDSTRTNCQAKRDSINAPNFLYPKYLGKIIGSGVSPIAATGKITLTSPQADGAQGNLTSILVGGATEVLTGAPRTLPAGQTANQWATLIAGWVGNGYTATATNNVVTITHPTAGAPANGTTISVSTNITGRTPANITINITNTNRASSSPNWGSVSQLTIDGLSFLGGTIVCDLAGCASSSATTRNNTMAQIIRTRLTPPAGWTVGGNNAQIVITAPAGTGSEKNSIDVIMTTSRTTASNASGGAMKLAGGITTGDVNLTTQNFSGGSDASQHAEVGRFVRTNILPGQTYNKFPGRSDCVTSADHCT